MIFDQQNMFIDGSLETTNVIVNAGAGDAADPLFLVIAATTGLTASGSVTAKLQTCAAENFGSGVVTLAEYTLAKATTGLLVKAKVPYGALQYLRLSLTGSPSAGVLTAGLTETVPNWRA